MIITINDRQDQTPSPDDDKLGLTNKNQINEYEAKGIATAEFFVLQLESDVEISVQLISEIHRIALLQLYDWAG